MLSLATPTPIYLHLSSAYLLFLNEGTHVAGIAGGTRFGVAKKATLIAVRVLDSRGSGCMSPYFLYSFSHSNSILIQTFMSWRHFLDF